MSTLSTHHLKKLPQLFFFGLLFFLISMSQVFAYENGLALKGGGGIGYFDLGALNQSEEHKPGAGINTYFGYKHNRWTLDAGSNIYFSSFRDLDLKAQGIELNSVSGDMRSLSISTILKYNTRWQPRVTWDLYFGLGPSWSLLTFTLNDKLLNQGFRSDDKFVYESYGGSLVIGLIEQTRYKQMHPVYFELTIQYLKSHELSTVDASNSAEIEIISKEEIKQIEGFFYFFNIGIIIF